MIGPIIVLVSAIFLTLVPVIWPEQLKAENEQAERQKHRRWADREIRREKKIRPDFTWVKF